MPELPEVETVRRGLARNVPGRTVADVEVFHPRAIRRQTGGAAEMRDSLVGARFIGTARRGKFVWLPTDRGDAFLAHLGMSGQLLLHPADTPDPTHLRVRVTFDDDGPQLRFVDQRTFGYVVLDRGGAALPSQVAHIARDPLDPELDDAAVISALSTRRIEIKRALLDQTIISGIGNIYADEALWRAQVHGRTLASDLPPEKLAELLDHVRQVLQEAITAGGTSFDALYVGVDGESGWFGRSLDAYGRAGQPCRRCGTPIVREKWTNRSSHFCPTCQVLPA